MPEVYEVLSRFPDFARWWPSVYLEANELEPGSGTGVGKVVGLHTRGWLPYTLRWEVRIIEVRPPCGYSFAASGDFVGRGVWSFAPDGPYTAITFDWHIRAEKPLLRYLSFLLKPLFAANHRWAMSQGERSLQNELARRRLGGAARPA
jgi:hypothetical protein